MPSGVFLVSYLEPRTPNEEYMGDSWVGTSHESDTPGIVRHSLAWIEKECAERDLVVEAVPGHAFDGQTWLRIRHKGAERLMTRIDD